MLNLAKQVLKTIADDKEYANLVAKGLRNFHDALIQQGFSEGQAMEIVGTQGLNFLLMDGSRDK